MDELSRQGIEHFNGGRFEQALLSFRAAVAAGRGGPEARVFIAHVLDAAARPEEALAEFRFVIKDFPRHRPAYDGLAALLLRRGASQAATSPLRGALALRPEGKDRRGLIGTLRLCAQAWRAANEFETAEEALQKALRLAPGDKESRRRLLEILQAREQYYLSKSSGNEAEPYEAKPDSGFVRDLSRKRRAALLRRRSQEELAAGRVRDAEQSLREALLRDPRDRESRRQLGELLRRHPLAKPSKVETLRRAALLQVCAGRLAAAEAALRRALKLAPRDKDSRRQMLEVALMRGQDTPPGKLELAEKALLRALKLKPGDRDTRRRLIDVLRRRARARLAAGELEAAERIMSRALAMEPRNHETRARLVEALSERARAMQSAGQRRKAEGLARRILKLDPSDARAVMSRGEVLYISGRVREGQGLLRQALRLDRGTLSPTERFKTLMKLGRHRKAIAVAETILDGAPGLEDVRSFWDPWEWDERRARADHLAELKKLERSLGPETPSPWLHYYRAGLTGPLGLDHFDRLADYSAERYGWMYFRAGFLALGAARFESAAAWLEISLRHKPVDWRARCFLAEARLCLQDHARADAEMDRALSESPREEAPQVLAWRGAFDLWLGRYEEALPRLEEACRQGAQCAFCWKGAALLKLGRPREALAQLDLTLERYPLDFEAWIWRGETKRTLGLFKEALADLAKVPPGMDLWALFNRALAKAALGDRAGLQSDFNKIPIEVVDYIRGKTGLEDMEQVLQAGIELSRGFRRGEYRQAVWMS
jgi:tetratricopeptide (TPR) repeat protein